MGILEGKRGLIVGIANDRSIASGITESVLAQGGQCLFTHLPGDKMERRIRMSLDELGVKDPWVMPMDAGSDEQMDQVFAKIQSEFGTLDFLVHCIAYAERDWLKVGAFAATPRSVFTQAMDLSAHTYQAMAHRAAPMMTQGGSMIALSYYGAEKAVPGYNVMGVAKAALEAACAQKQKRRRKRHQNTSWP